MTRIKLNFWGYTWEDFVPQISERKGIFLVYKGKLDNEGFVKVTELLYIDYTKASLLYPSEIIDSIKKELNKTEMLFFSFANVDERIADEVLKFILSKISTSYNQKTVCTSCFIIESTGNCDFFPPIIK